MLICAACCRQVPPPLLTSKAAGSLPGTQQIQTPAGVWSFEQITPDSFTVILHPATKEQRTAAKQINRQKRQAERLQSSIKQTEAANKIDTIKAQTAQTAVENIPLSLFFLLLIVVLLTLRRIFTANNTKAG